MRFPTAHDSILSFKFSARTYTTSRYFLQAKPDSEIDFRYYYLHFYYITVVNILFSLLLNENLKNLEN